MEQMALGNNMESLKLKDVFQENALELDDVIEEGRPNCALPKCEVKVEELSDEQVEVLRENSINCPPNITYKDSNVMLNIKEEYLQPELVAFSKEGLPIAVKSEKDLNIFILNDQSLDGEYKDLKCNEQTIKEEYLVKSETIDQEEFDIKTEDEEEDRLIRKLPTDQIKKQLADPPAFQCLDCTYQTHGKRNIARHVLRHTKKALECSHCSFKIRDKKIFKQHQLLHKKLHKCPECSYASVRKYDVTQHMIRHKKPDDITWHGCTLCCYRTSQKATLTSHIQRKHRPKDDNQLIHCQEEGCSYKTHYKLNLGRHIKMMHQCNRFFNCSKCSYQTKYSESLKAHQLGHKDQNEWFSCTLCSYKSNFKSNLKMHMLVHKSDSEIKWFECSECPFKTKHSNSLRIHKWTHKPSPQNILECSQCSYKTAFAHRLQDHGLVHKKPEEISEWFCCYLCTLKTPYKNSLASHIRRVHRDTNGRIKSYNEMK